MRCKLSQICDIINEKIATNELINSNLLYISTENMLPNKCGIVAPSSIPTNEKVTKYKKNDVLVSNIRPYFKKIWFASNDGGCSNDVLVFRAKSGFSPMYLHYILANDDFFEYAMQTSKGTKMPRGDKKTIMEYEIQPMTLEVQEKSSIALNLIDDKIAINTAINENLEQQAQAIYNHMFIENSEKSWKLGALSDIAVITMGQSPKGDTFNETGNGTVFYQGRTDFGFRFPTRRLYTTEPKRIAMWGDTLISVRAPVGDLNVAYEECCIGRGLAAIHSKYDHQSFVLYTLFTLKKQLDVFNCEGTVFGSIGKDPLNSMEIVIPPKNLIEQFESIVNPIDKIIFNNYEEICRLQVIRDSLLPKLMNGEIDVSNVKI